MVESFTGRSIAVTCSLHLGQFMKALMFRFFGRLQWLILAGVLSLLILGCGGGTRGTETGERSLVVEGTLLEPSGAALANVLVTVDDLGSTHTDSLGYFILEGQTSDGKALQIIVEAEGKTASTQLVEVSPSVTSLLVEGTFDPELETLDVVVSPRTPIATATSTPSKTPVPVPPTASPAPTKTATPTYAPATVTAGPIGSPPPEGGGDTPPTPTPPPLGN